MAAVAGIERQCFTLPWTERQLCLALEQRAFSVFGLKRDRRLLAYASVYHTESELEILNLAVVPERRHEGLGGALLGGVLSNYSKTGIVRCVLEARQHNAHASALYRSLGFVPIGRRPDYYPDTHEDAVIYALDMAGFSRGKRRDA
jgi:ribosomal-protein-alanine N-acetyltransferase